MQALIAISSTEMGSVLPLRNGARVERQRAGWSVESHIFFMAGSIDAGIDGGLLCGLVLSISVWGLREFEDSEEGLIVF